MRVVHVEVQRLPHGHFERQHLEDIDMIEFVLSSLNVVEPKR